MKTAVLSCPKSRNDLNSAVRNVLEYAYRDQSDLQRLTLDLSHGELLVRLERAPLERIISNLLSNALKYSPPHCPITITTRYDHQQAILQVNNKGTPIPHAEQKILFDKYARASAAGRSSGSGLGLFIVKTTAESAGGAVELESDSINGTTFTVSLPCAEEP